MRYKVSLMIIKTGPIFFPLSRKCSEVNEFTELWISDRRNVNIEKTVCNVCTGFYQSNKMLLVSLTETTEFALHN